MVAATPENESRNSYHHSIFNLTKQLGRKTIAKGYGAVTVSILKSNFKFNVQLNQKRKKKIHLSNQCTILTMSCIDWMELAVAATERGNTHRHKQLH